MRWDCQNLFVIAGFAVVVCFHIFYCNSAGFSGVFRYNRVFVIVEFHCITHKLIANR